MINIIKNFFLVFILNVKSINKSLLPLFNNYFKFYNETIINQTIINQSVINQTIINGSTNHYNEDDEIDFILFETLILPID